MSDEEEEDDQMDWTEFLRTEAPKQQQEKQGRKLTWIKGLRVKKPKPPGAVKKDG